MSKTKYNLDQYNYSIAEGFNYYITTLTYKTLSKYFYGDTCLELGSADGLGTEIILKHFRKVTSVDGSGSMIKKLKKRLGWNKNLEIIHSYIEDLKLNKTFDTILLTHVLEHVVSPQKVLQVIKKHAVKTTTIIIEVPSAYSIHRQAGVLLKLIQEEHELNKADKSVGHVRVYDMSLLTKEVERAGLAITQQGGFLMKPFSNKQMLRSLDNPLQDITAYNQLGIKYPELAAEIFVICKAK